MDQIYIDEQLSVVKLGLAVGFNVKQCWPLYQLLQFLHHFERIHRFINVNTIVYKSNLLRFFIEPLKTDG